MYRPSSIASPVFREVRVGENVRSRAVSIVMTGCVCRAVRPLSYRIGKIKENSGFEDPPRNVPIRAAECRPFPHSHGPLDFALGLHYLYANASSQAAPRQNLRLCSLGNAARFTGLYLIISFRWRNEVPPRNVPIRRGGMPPISSLAWPA